MVDGVEFKDIKRKKKTAISITVNSENLEFLKEDMKHEGFGDMPLSLVFDSFLEQFVESRKKTREKKEDGEKKK